LYEQQATNNEQPRAARETAALRYSSPVRRELTVILLFCALTAVMTWPLVVNMTTALGHPEDPAINTWILDWNFYAFSREPARLFHANIFHPHRYTFAFSENLLGIALPLLPLHLAGLRPITIYNVATFLAFALTGYGAYVLGRVAAASTGAAICGGIWFAFMSFRWVHLTHLQHLWALGLPLMLAALLWFAREPTPRRAMLFGFAFLMNGLANLHFFAFGSVAIAIAVIILGSRDRRYWTGAISALVTACALMLPVLLPYQRARNLYAMRGDARETLQYSAHLGDWLISSPYTRWYTPLFDANVHPERWLFPGALVLLFAAVGLTYRSRATAIGVVWVALGVFGSLGLNGVVGRLLFELPLFQGIRAPARWSFIAYTGLALLAMCGIAKIKWKPLHALIAVAFVVELHVAPLRWYLANPDPSPVDRWLASRANDVVVELPLDQRHQYGYLLRAAHHHRTLINGVSGFTPRAFEELAASQFGPEFQSRLERHGAGTIVVHADLLGDRAPAARAWLREQLAAQRLAYVRRFDAEVEGDYVFVTRAHRDFHPHVPPDLRVNLERFLNGETTQNEGTFGKLEKPVWDGRAHWRARIEGWAMSPWGVDAVYLRFANGRVVVPADLIERPDIDAKYPWYPMTAKAGFVKELDPLDVPSGTDVQVEIVDGRGRRTRLQDVWFTWTR
jgi:hypothetical protein